MSIFDRKPKVEITCPRCGGRGRVPGFAGRPVKAHKADGLECPKCHGRGTVKVDAGKA